MEAIIAFTLYHNYEVHVSSEQNILLRASSQGMPADRMTTDEKDDGDSSDGDGCWW